jgi:hypothetical protein
VVRLSIEKMGRLGWRPSRGSREGLREAMAAMLADLRAGRDRSGAA